MSDGEASAADIVAFWRAVGPDRWFEKDETLDAEIRRRFLRLHEAAAGGKLVAWEQAAEGALALLILLDQFPRNMFRGSAKAFATDPLACAVAERAIEQGHNMEVPDERRVFFYLPFEHAEDLALQDRCCELVRERCNLGEYVDYAERHRAVIARFGRFPHRNAVLGRPSTMEEIAYLESSDESF
jgi:uncharacterized protein (DUF924 family)